MYQGKSLITFRMALVITNFWSIVLDDNWYKKMYTPMMIVDVRCYIHLRWSCFWYDMNDSFLTKIHPGGQHCTSGPCQIQVGPLSSLFSANDPHLDWRIRIAMAPKVIDSLRVIQNQCKNCSSLSQARLSDCPQRVQSQTWCASPQTQQRAQRCGTGSLTTAIQKGAVQFHHSN